MPTESRLLRTRADEHRYVELSWVESGRVGKHAFGLSLHYLYIAAWQVLYRHSKFPHSSSISMLSRAIIIIIIIIEGKISRVRQAHIWMDKIKEDSKTNNLNIRTATDLLRDRTRWGITVQTHRQPIADGRE